MDVDQSYGERFMAEKLRNRVQWDTGSGKPGGVGVAQAVRGGLLGAGRGAELKQAALKCPGADVELTSMG